MLNRLINIRSGSSPRQFKCKRLDGVRGPDDRQKRIPGWNQEKLEQATVLLGGAGGANGENAEALVKKGVGNLHICDHDNVSPSNLNRQKFRKKDLWKNKAVCLARNMSSQGFLGTKIIGYPIPWQSLALDRIKIDVIICAVDMQIENSREDLVKKAHALGIPTVIEAISDDADYGYVFVQIPGEACWWCVFGGSVDQSNSVEEDEKKCPVVGASIDILKGLSGHVLYAVDSIIMNRSREWNYRTISLRSSELCRSMYVNPRENCPICGGK